MGEPYLPAAVLELFRYGKTLNGPAKTSLIRLISVPKSYFTHFYIFSSIYVFITLMYVIHIYTNNKKVDESVLEFLDLACSSQRSAGTSSSQLLIVLVLLMIQVKKKRVFIIFITVSYCQVARRLYECLFINQPSSSTMNITHYIVGFAHYFCATTGFVCEAPGFVRSTSSITTSVSISSVPGYSWILVAVFCVAWWHQFQSHKIFAQLKLKSPNTHSIPSGSLFTFVSCPHYLCEVIIYTCFMFILGTHHTTGVLGKLFPKIKTSLFV